MPKKVLIALPPAMLEQVDLIATHEHRTRSDLIREALRRYLEKYRTMKEPALPVTTLPAETFILPPPPRVEHGAPTLRD